MPDEIHQVPGIPRTLSGKKLEVPVRKILHGTDPERAADPNALANPDVLRYFGRFQRRARRLNTDTKGVDAMPDGYEDEAREALLAKAAQAWEDDPALDPQAIGDGSGGDGVWCYLRAYYQRVATEDLAPPSRLAAVAEAHARLGLSRPQGRALVQVREPSDAQLHSVSRSGLVVDIVIDDMPYLVDRSTTELNRHEAEIRLLVHPVLRVRRDVTGALRGILGVCADASPDVPGQPEADEITESWIHVELGPPRDKVTADQLAAELRHVLDDVRVAVEDQARMGAMARSLAATWAASPAATGPSTAICSAGWPTATSSSSATASTTWSGPPTAPGCAPCPAPASASCATPSRARSRCARCRPRSPAGAGPGRTPGAGQGQLQVHRLPGQLPGLRSRSRSSGPNDTVTGEYRFLGLYTHAAHTAPIAGVPVLRRKLPQVLAEAGLSKDSHDGKDLVEILEDYPREELFEISPEELTPIALGVLRLKERKQTRLFLRRDRYGRYMSCLVYLPRDRYTTRVRLRAQGILREALHGASVDYSATVGDSALARLYVVVRFLIEQSTFCLKNVLLQSSRERIF